METTHRIAEQTRSWARFARVSVTVEPAAAREVLVASDAHRDSGWRREALLGARRALRDLASQYQVTVTRIVTGPADTGIGDVYEATARAVWTATGLGHEHRSAGFSEPEQVAAKFDELVGRELNDVTESRHWFDGVRADDAQSLIHVWLHFGYGAPIRLHGCGDALEVSVERPHKSYDMDRHGQVKVGPAQAPDLLYVFIGRRLIGFQIFRGCSAEPQCGGLLLDFDGFRLVIGTLADEWVLAEGDVPVLVAAYWTAWQQAESGHDPAI